MTRRGFLFTVIFALLLLLAMATGFSEIYYMGFLCGLILVFSLGSSLLGARLLRMEHRLSHHAVVQGENTAMQVTTRAGLLLPAALRVELAYPAYRKHSYVDYILLRRQETTAVQLPCPHRGRWRVGIVDARCGDLFGLFSFRLSAAARPAGQLHVTVYPLMVDIPGEPQSPPEANDTENPHQNADQGDTFSDTRLYRDGDTMKRIHWKMSIRAGELYTRQYEAPAAQAALIVLDTMAMPGEAPEMVMGYADMATSAAASLALFYLSGGYVVRIAFTGYAGDLGRQMVLVRSQEEFEETYAALAIAPFEPDGRPRTPAIMDTVFLDEYGMDDVRKLYVITRRPDYELVDSLSAMCSRRLAAALVYLEPAYSPARPAQTPDGLHLLPITCPRDIMERMGAGI